MVDALAQDILAISNSCSPIVNVDGVSAGAEWALPQDRISPGPGSLEECCLLR
jgi:hypothetical protein